MEPVGSKTLVRRFRLQASSSTVRSDMGALEHKGFLTQPHTSAGRIPSPQGYRHYVNCLLPPPGVAVQHLERELTKIKTVIRNKLLQLNRIKNLVDVRDDKKKKK